MSSLKLSASKKNPSILTLQIKIETEQAYNEIKELYGFTKDATAFQLFRKMITKLMETEESIKIILNNALLPKWQQDDGWKLCYPLKKKLSCLIRSSFSKKTNEITIECGYLLPPKSFADECKQKLKDIKVRAIDILKRDMPEAYKEQPHHFANRLTDYVKLKVSVIDLGDTYRFVKQLK